MTIESTLSNHARNASAFVADRVFEYAHQVEYVYQLEMQD